MALRVLQHSGRALAHGSSRRGSGAGLVELVRRSSNSSRSGGACGGGEESSSSRSGAPTCSLTCAPVHTAVPTRTGLIVPAALPVGLPPRQYHLGETDFGMQEQISVYTSQEARSLGMMTIDDILADFNRVTITNQRKAEKAIEAAAARVEAEAECTDSAEDLSDEDSTVQAVKRTFQPNTLRRKRKFGFLARVGDKDGRKILQRRRAKGREGLSS